MTLPLLPLSDDDPGHGPIFAHARQAAAVARTGMSDILFGAGLLLGMLGILLASGAVAIGLLAGWAWAAPAGWTGIILLACALLLQRASARLQADADLPFTLPGTVAHGRHLLERGRDLPDLPGTGDLALLRAPDRTGWIVAGSGHARADAAAAIAADTRPWEAIMVDLAGRRGAAVALVRHGDAVVALVGPDWVPIGARLPPPSLLRP